MGGIFTIMFFDNVSSFGKLNSFGNKSVFCNTCRK